MGEDYKDQIKNLINNFTTSRGHVPFFWELEQHPAFGPAFKALNHNERIAVNQIIKESIEDKITNLKTKWGQLFRRFFENNTAKFWEFRTMNEDASKTNTPAFQKLWKEIENEMFTLEWILTQAMMKREQGLEKTVDSFYTIVYCYFPLFGKIE